jgi:hypothetical protein
LLFLLCPQLPVEKWYEIIGDKTVADAILDRLVYLETPVKLSTKYRSKLSTPFRAKGITLFQSLYLTLSDNYEKPFYEIMDCSV